MQFILIYIAYSTIQTIIFDQIHFYTRSSMLHFLLKQRHQKGMTPEHYAIYVHYIYISVDTHIAMKQTLKFMRHKSYNNVCIKEIDFSYITKHKSLNDMFRTSRQRERIIIKSHKNCIFRINAFLFPVCIILALIESGRVHIRCIHIFFVGYLLHFIHVLSVTLWV